VEFDSGRNKHQRRLNTAKGRMQRRKTVIHIHTNYSFDANTSPDELLATARAQNVECLVITDHDEIEGARAVRERGEIDVVIGEEVSSRDGHILGLFLHKRIDPGMSAEDTARAIKDQGGLVMAPHPFTVLCDDSLHAATERLLPWLDGIEICNAQDLLPWENNRARRFADEHGLLHFVGADTHIRGYLDTCYQMMPAFDGPETFLDALRNAELFPGRFPIGYFARMGARHVWDMFMRHPLPGFGANVLHPELFTQHAHQKGVRA
jgi:predicted metal-dependent phosphoesterase TrpH